MPISAASPSTDVRKTRGRPSVVTCALTFLVGAVCLAGCGGGGASGKVGGGASGKEWTGPPSATSAGGKALIAFNKTVSTNASSGRIWSWSMEASMFSPESSVCAYGPQPGVPGAEVISLVVVKGIDAGTPYQATFTRGILKLTAEWSAPADLGTAFQNRSAPIGVLTWGDMFGQQGCVVKANGHIIPAKIGHSITVHSTPAPSTNTTPAPSTNTTGAALDQAVNGFNQSVMTGITSNFAQVGQTDCVLGQSADFASTYVVTVISSNGYWLQLPVTNGQADLPSHKEGSDYNVALNGQTWQQFKASGLPCTVAKDGTIALSP
jgi:hypothetical protein